MIKIPLVISSLMVLGALNGYGQNRAPLRATFLNQLRNDDAGGSVSVDRFDLRFGAPLIRSEDVLLALGMRYSFDQYHFQDTSADWGDIRNSDLGLAWRWKLNDRWLWGNYGSLGLGVEEGADISGGIKFHHISILEYRWNDRLTIGPGLGISDKIDQGVSVFPIIAFQWQMNDDLLLGSGPSDVSAAGANVYLEYLPQSLGERWIFTTGFAYSGNSFKLAGDAGDPTSSAEERLASVYAAVSYKWESGAKVSLIGGYHLLQSFEIFDESGDLLSKEILEDAPYVGLSVGMEF